MGPIEDDYSLLDSTLHETFDDISDDSDAFEGSLGFQQCRCGHQLRERSEKLRREFYEAHLDIKDKLIQNLQLIIDEQEGRISDLRSIFKAETGRSSPLTLSEQKMLRGISHLSVEFGQLSDENFALKEELHAAEIENRRLQLKLSTTVTNFSHLPLLMDNEVQTEEDFDYSRISKADSSISDKDSVLQDTEEEFMDDTASETTTVSSGVNSDTRPKSSTSLEHYQMLEENAQLKQEISDLKKTITDQSEHAIQLQTNSEASIQRLLQRFEEEVSLRKALHDALVQLRGNIRVFCRVRPSKLAIEGPIKHDPLDCDALTVSTDSGVKRFLFDRVFGDNADQIDMYAEVEPLVLSCIDGMNVCIFAYGQTGAGKTYTMDGPDTNPGIGSRALIQIFQELEKRSDDVDFTINVSLIEIYNEKIRDLLDDSASQKLELRLEKDGKMRISNMSKCSVDSVAKVKEIIESGRKNRSVAATALNDQSSRSHAITMIEISMRDKASNSVCIGRLNLIDLAGSERVSKSQVSGPQLKEAQFINKSLSELGNVVSALRRKQQHVPFRNCVLTRILEDSLDGDSKTLMIVQVAPEKTSIQETISSLNFAEKISNVTRRTAKKPLNAQK
uniref:Kinesin-like protein n=1 Tax=Panagrellus redivivus TaxID=6233 RepID=A0A7E4ZXC6_PANRE